MIFPKQNLLIFFFWIAASNLLAPFKDFILRPYLDRLDPHPAKKVATEVLSLKKSHISGEELLKTIIYCLELPMIKWILCDGCELELSLFLSEIQDLIKATHNALLESDIYLQKLNIILIGIKTSSKLKTNSQLQEICHLNFWKKFLKSPITTNYELIMQQIIEEEEASITNQAIRMFQLIWLKNGFFLANNKLKKIFQRNYCHEKYNLDEREGCSSLSHISN